MLAANPAHDDSPHSSVLGMHRQQPQHNSVVGRRQGPEPAAQEGGGKKAFHILLPTSFFSQAGPFSQPTHSGQLDPAVCCFQANSWGMCAARQVLRTSIFGGLPDTNCILVSPLFEGEVFHGTEGRPDAQGDTGRLRGQVSLVASGTCRIGWAFLDAGC